MPAQPAAALLLCPHTPVSAAQLVSHHIYVDLSLEKSPVLSQVHIWQKYLLLRMEHCRLLKTLGDVLTSPCQQPLLWKLIFPGQSPCLCKG